MAQGDKSTYYQALKKAGYEFDQHYREYTTDDLVAIWEQFNEESEEELEDPELPDSPIPEPQPDEAAQLAELQERFDRLTNLVGNLADALLVKGQKTEAPVRDAMAPESTEHAGLTQNRNADDVIHVDDEGNKWYQMEVVKPGWPKPRGRRILRTDGGATKKETIRVGEFTESFEVYDGATKKPLEIKITLPSHQTGIYLPPNMPFRVHTYRGVRGFDLFDVQRFYGAADLVPSTIKRVYVGQTLCYDITTTIRAIENEYRERVLRVEKGIGA